MSECFRKMKLYSPKFAASNDDNKKEGDLG